MHGNDGKRFVGIDSFEFHDTSLEKIEANLAHYGLDAPEIVVGDAFELVPAGARSATSRSASGTTTPITRTRRTLHGLRIAEPHLASPAPSSSPTTPTGTTSSGRWTTTSPPSHVPVAF